MVVICGRQQVGSQACLKKRKFGGPQFRLFSSSYPSPPFRLPLPTSSFRPTLDDLPLLCAPLPCFTFHLTHLFSLFHLFHSASFLLSLISPSLSLFLQSPHLFSLSVCLSVFLSLLFPLSLSRYLYKFFLYFSHSAYNYN